MNEEKILKAAKKIIKMKIQKLLTRLLYNIIRAVLTFAGGLVILGIILLACWFGAENGKMDITFPLFMLPFIISNTKERFVKYYLSPKKGKVVQSNV